MWPFSNVQYGFRSCLSTAFLQKVVSDRFARAFKRSAATRTVTLDIFQDFDRVGESSQEWVTESSLEFLKALFLVLLYINKHRDYAICNIANYVDTTL